MVCGTVGRGADRTRDPRADRTRDPRADRTRGPRADRATVFRVKGDERGMLLLFCSLRELTPPCECGLERQRLFGFGSRREARPCHESVTASVASPPPLPNIQSQSPAPTEANSPQIPGSIRFGASDPGLAPAPGGPEPPRRPNPSVQVSSAVVRLRAASDPGPGARSRIGLMTSLSKNILHHRGSTPSGSPNPHRGAGPGGRASNRPTAPGPTGGATPGGPQKLLLLEGLAVWSAHYPLAKVGYQRANPGTTCPS